MVSNPRDRRRESEGEGDFARLAENAPDIIARYDRGQRHLYVNPAVTAATGRPAGEFIGKTNEELGMPAAQCRQWRAFLDTVFREGRPGTLEFTFPSPDGLRHYSMRAVPEPDSEGGIATVMVITRDVTEQKRVEQALHQSNALSVALNRINEDLHSTLDVDAVLQLLVQRGSEALSCESAAVSLRRDQGWEIAHVRGLSEALVGTVMTDADEQHAVMAIESGQLVGVSDVEADERVNRDHLRRHHIRSVLVVPLIARGEGLGALFFNYHRAPHTFTPAELDFARQLSVTTAHALENARLFDEVMRTREQLRQSEDRLHRAMLAGNVFSFDWDLRSGTVVRSPHAASILGLNPADAAREPAREFLERMAPEERDQLIRRIADLHVDAPGYEFEFRYRRPDTGRMIWLGETGQGAFDEHGRLTAVRGMIADVTSRIQAYERKAEAAAARTAAQSAVDTINAMGEGVALLGMDGRIRTVNPAFAHLTGYEIRELEGHLIAEILPDLFEEHPSEVEQTIARVRLKESRMDGMDALTATTRDGLRKWVVPTVSSIYSIENEPVAMVLTLRDISPLIQVQEQLRESERKYRELVEDANAIIIRVSADRRITFFNDYAQGFFGYRAKEVLGRPLIGTIAPEFTAEGHDLRRITEDVVAHPELHGSVDSENLCKDGRRVWVHWSNRAIRDALGNVKEVLCVGADITRRVMLERQARSYRQRLKDLANRLLDSEEQERRRVATHLHDTVIQTLSLSNIRLGGVLAAVQKAGLHAPEERIRGIRSLLNEGIRECRELMGELVPPLLYEVGLCAALREFAEKQSGSDGTPIRVAGDDADEPLPPSLRNLLFQCARELTMNALKHAGPCEIAISLSHTTDQVVLQVRDTGRGFDRNRGNPADAGRKQGGFGLFNIRERLEGLGGTLEIESTPGRGTVATIRTPPEVPDNA